MKKRHLFFIVAVINFFACMGIFACMAFLSDPEFLQFINTETLESQLLVSWFFLSLGLFISSVIVAMIYDERKEKESRMKDDLKYRS